MPLILGLFYFLELSTPGHLVLIFTVSLNDASRNSEKIVRDAISFFFTDDCICELYRMNL